MTNVLSQIDFGNEAGDDVDSVEIASYFVEQPAFRKFLNPSSKILVSTAKKGVGKSALVKWTEFCLKQTRPDDLVIFCRGADLTRSRFNLAHELRTPNDHIRDWMVRLCAVANRALANRIGLAITDDKISLVESAEIDGFKSRNLIGCLLERLGGLIPYGRPDKIRVKDEIEVFKRHKNPKLWLLIDDLDATFQNTSTEQLELSTCFTACRYLTQDLKDVHIRATMRTDVWPLIRRFDESLDKMEQYVTEIVWGREDFQRILHSRIKSQLEKQNLPFPKFRPSAREDEIARTFINEVFVNSMEWAQKEVPTCNVIYTLSYQRPRWGIQLCKLAQEQALREGQSRINKSHIDAIWGAYGTKRIADLVSEHKHQCREVEELLNAFRGCDRLMTRDSLFDWINRRVVPHIETTIEGKKTRSPREIAQFLYRIGFILARSDSKEKPASLLEEDGKQAHYEHYSFADMPDFLSTRTDEDFGVGWEIHPCYREALDIRKVDRSHKARLGRLRNDSMES